MGKQKPFKEKYEPLLRIIAPLCKIFEPIEDNSARMCEYDFV
jgi:hypothetical protein